MHILLVENNNKVYEIQIHTQNDDKICKIYNNDTFIATYYVDTLKRLNEGIILDNNHYLYYKNIKEIQKYLLTLV